MRKTDDMRIEYVSLDELQTWPNNPKLHAKEQIDDSIERFGFVAPIVLDEKTGRIVAGHGRLESLRKLHNAGAKPPARIQIKGGAWFAPVVRGIAFENEREAEAYLLADNRLVELGGWDEKALAEILVGLEAAEVPVIGWNESEVADLLRSVDGGPSEEVSQEAQSTLAERFGVPPFSVLDARQGYWQKRKRAWLDLGIDPVAGREHLPATAGIQDTPSSAYAAGRGATAGGSSFDPVLCELAYRWFCPPGGSILDPFAGESTKGIVAGVLRHPYTGVDVRQEQIDANYVQAERLKIEPRWICGDSAKIDDLLPEGELYDMSWSSPPYYDLEIYSEHEKDGSAFATYPKFMSWMTTIYRQVVARLREGRFVGIKVGEIRDKQTGVYRNFVGDVVRMMIKLGLRHLAIATKPTRRLDGHRTKGSDQDRLVVVPEAHQNVLWFYKGDPATIRDSFPPEIEMGLEGFGAELPGEANQE